jgi:hypothetical protein
MKLKDLLATAVILPIFASAPAQALSLFTGYDANTLNTNANPQVVPVAARVNTTAAFNSYLANLGGIGVTTESFETTAVGTVIDGLSQTLSGVNATYSYKTKANPAVSAGSGPTQSVQQADLAGFTNSGTYPTDGVRGISINSVNLFKINFASPLAAFSFWGTDLGDSSNVLTVILRRAGVQVAAQPIDYLGANPGNSSIFFFGGIAQNSTELFDEVELLSLINTNGDAIGLDQITVGTQAQVTPVPTPAMLPGLVGLGMAALRKRKGQVA